MNEHWIKLSMTIFENRKIKMIMRGKDGYRVFVIWIKLLCLAGKLADGGELYVIRELPYSDSDLAAELDISLKELLSAMEIFTRLGMVVKDGEGVPRVKNFADYQSIDELRDIREYNRLAKQKQRARQKAELERCKAETAVEAENMQNVLDMSLTTSAADKNESSLNTEKKIKKSDEIREEREKREKREKREETEETVACGTERTLLGEYGNVNISDEEAAELRRTYPDVAERMIEELSSYIASKGNSYVNHFATLKRWAAKAVEEAERQRKKEEGRSAERPRYGDFDPLEAFNNSLKRAWSDKMQ